MPKCERCGFCCIHYSGLLWGERIDFKRWRAYKTKKAPKKPKPVLMIPKPKEIVWIKDKMNVEEWSFNV